MSDAQRGLPLLSGPPPTSNVSQPDSCRKCGKEFNILFARSRKCNHCGYLYCHSCTDYQALMPRTGPETGYDVMHVCGHCIEHLTITAGGKSYLKSLPLGKLKKYANAYNIKINHAVEKDDVIEALLAARSPNGCLPPGNENYYRKYSVPAATDQRSGFRNMFRSPQAQPSQTAPPPPPRPQHNFPRPDLAPDTPPPQARPPPPPRPQQPQQQQYRPPPGPPPRPQPQSYYRVNPHARPQHQAPGGWGQYPGQAYQQGYNPHYNYQPPPPPPQASRPTPPRPAPSAPPRDTRPPPPPNLDELLNMTPDDINHLSISALKSILFTNHVNTGQVLEKAELVKKVLSLIEDEKAERERQREAQELEELERQERERERQEELERERRLREEREREQRERDVAAAASEAQTQAEAQASSSENTNASADANAEAARATSPGDHPPAEPAEPPQAAAGPSPPKPAPQAQAPPRPRPHVERSGLCVVCQDEEANIAIVDCGHLAMCRGCSDLIMNSSRECPLCRTRIVTEARLLRIFKT